MVSKEEIRIFEKCQFFDKHGVFPFEKRKKNFTLSGEAIEKLSTIKNKSEYINNLILSQ